jgi:hypothetical protein
VEGGSPVKLSDEWAIPFDTSPDGQNLLVLYRDAAQRTGARSLQLKHGLDQELLATVGNPVRFALEQRLQMLPDDRQTGRGEVSTNAIRR